MHSSSSQKTNIRVSTDMQSTNYTIKNTSKILPLVRPSSFHTSQLKHSMSFETVGLNVRPFCTDLIQSEQISVGVQLFSLANPCSASIKTGQSVTSLEILP